MQTEINNKVWSKEEKVIDDMNAYWSKLTPQKIDFHIRQSMIRNQIDNITFRVKSLYKLNEQDQDKFLDYHYDGKTIDDDKIKSFH